MNKIKKTIFYLLGFAVLMFATMVVINLPAFDEDLIAEVVAIKNIDAKPFNENNALPALLAINSQSGSNLQQATSKVRKFLNQKIKNSGIDYLTDDEYQQLMGHGHDDSWRNRYTSCNSRTNVTCMTQIFDDVKIKTITDPRLIEQLARYRELIAMSEFSDVTQHDMNAPLMPISTTMTLKRIFLADTYLTQSETDFMQTVLQDARFWRMILSNSNLLITKMVGVTSYRDALNSISVATRQGLFEPTELKQLLEHLKPLSFEESNMSRVFDYEFKYTIDWFENLEQQNETGLADAVNFFQSNATINTHYTYVIKPLKKMAKLDATGFYQWVKNDQAANNFDSPYSWLPSTLYNPTGKLLTSNTIPAYTDYFGRIHDLNGMIHLLKLQLELALSPEQSIEQVINQSQWVNPYTSAPMSYDSGRIYFACMDKSSSCELLL